MEINPQKVVANYPAPQYTPCGPYPLPLDIYNPRQAVWNGSPFWLDPYQQLFNVQQSGDYILNPGHYYNIETTAGGDVYCVFDRDEIEPGDTAYIVILHQAEDGTLWDFDESCRFEVGMIEGCGGGNILVDTIQDKYFYDVAQPVMFVADSTILDTSITVGVRVGLIEGDGGGTASSPIHNNDLKDIHQLEKSKQTPVGNFIQKLKNEKYKKLTELKQKYIGTKQKLKAGIKENGNHYPLPSNPTEDYCFAGPFQTTPNTDAEVVVGGNDNWCDTIIICNSNEYLPNIILNQVPNGYYGLDICADTVRPLEGVNTFWTDTLYTFELSLCNNDQRQKLWFNINDNHTLKINYSYAICEGNLPPGQNCQFVDDWTGISETLDCDQYEAILHATYFYGNHSTPCYFFRNIIYAHEMEHIMDYQSAIDAAKISFYDGLDSVSVICSDFENMNSAKIYIQSLLDDRFNHFKRSGREEFIKIQMIGALRSETELGIKSYEQDVQNRKSVRAIINSQIDEANNTYGCSIIHLYE